MGYTHYITQHRDLTDDEWATFRAKAEQILQQHADLVAGWDGTGAPLLSDSRVSFNGIGSDGCETCAIDRRMRDLFDFEIREGRDYVFNFCKTRERPYDVVVRKIYRLAYDCAPGAFELDSDGGPEVFEE